MNTNDKPTGKIDTKVLLSTLWIVVMINMLKADILSLFIPGAADELAKTCSQHRHPDPPIDAGRRDHDGDFNCHDHPFARVEVQGESLGQHHRQPHHDCICCRRRSLLSTLHIHRSR